MSKIWLESVASGGPDVADFQILGIKLKLVRVFFFFKEIGWLPDSSLLLSLRQELLTDISPVNILNVITYQVGVVSRVSLGQFYENLMRNFRRVRASFSIPVEESYFNYFYVRLSKFCSVFENTRNTIIILGRTGDQN